MYDIQIEGRLQLISAVSLLEWSGLVRWENVHPRFCPVEQPEFDVYWESIRKVFGRLICWIVFSAGAEFLAKGVCLLNEIDIRNPKPFERPANPIGELESWIARYFIDPTGVAMERPTDFRSLGTLVTLSDLPGRSGTVGKRKKRKNNDQFLKRLCDEMRASAEDQRLLLVAYDFLRQTVRNRDAHAYRPNQRDDNFHLIPELFVKAFNILLGWVPGGQTALNEWRNEAEAFVKSLPGKPSTDQH
jgi:hypothetical protein